jgi:hypothetical protein
MREELDEVAQKHSLKISGPQFQSLDLICIYQIGWNLVCGLEAAILYRNFTRYEARE